MNSSVRISSKKNTYQRIKLLGEGAFGQVYLVQDNKLNQYALKQFKKVDGTFWDEIDMLKSINPDGHNYVLKYVENFIENGDYYITTEYCEDGDLGKLIKFYQEEKLFLTEDYILQFVYETTKGLDYLHNNNIIHRDIKPDNIFLKNNRAKIGDLGLSISTKESNSNFGGTPAYYSPEIAEALLKNCEKDVQIPEDITSMQSDMWALGCVLYELATLERAYSARKFVDLYRCIKDDKPPEIESSFLLASVLNKLFVKEKEKRPSAKVFCKCLKTIMEEKKVKEREIIRNAFSSFENDEEMTYFKKNRYRFVKKLGKKLFGTVYLVEDTEEFYKHKALKLINYNINPSELETVMREINIVKQASNSYLVAYLDDFKFFGQQCIVSEYCPNGDLSQMIQRYKRKGEKIPDKKLFNIALQLIRALNSLHSIRTEEGKRIIHRNIKPANIFFDLNKIKIGDMGVATTTGSISKAYTVAGAPYYVSPEIAAEQPHDQKTDVWSAGMVLYETITLERPFKGIMPAMIFNEIIKGDIDFRSIPENSDRKAGLKAIIKKMLQKVENRPTSNDIFKEIERLDQRTAD